MKPKLGALRRILYFCAAVLLIPAPAQGNQCYSMSGLAGKERFTIMLSIDPSRPAQSSKSSLVYSLSSQNNQATMLLHGNVYGSDSSMHGHVSVFRLPRHQGISVFSQGTNFYFSMDLFGSGLLFSNASLPPTLPPTPAFSTSNRVSIIVPKTEMMTGAVDAIGGTCPLPSSPSTGKPSSQSDTLDIELLSLLSEIAHVEAIREDAAELKSATSNTVQLLQAALTHRDLTSIDNAANFFKPLAAVLPRSSIRELLAEIVLKRFANLKFDVKDPLAEPFFDIWLKDKARRVNSVLSDDFSIVKLLVEAADNDSHSPELSRFRVFLYKKAVVVAHGLYYDGITLDLTPLRMKIGEALNQAGDHAEAITYLEEERQLLERRASNPPGMPSCSDNLWRDYLRNLLDLTRASSVVQDFSSAMVNIEKALGAIHSCAIVGPDVVLVPETLALAARVYWAEGNTDRVLETLDQFVMQYENTLEKSLDYANDKDLQAPYLRLLDATNLALAFLSQQKDERSLRLTFQLLTDRGGRLLEIGADRARINRQAGNTSLLRSQSMRVTLSLRGHSPLYKNVTPSDRVMVTAAVTGENDLVRLKLIDLLWSEQYVRLTPRDVYRLRLFALHPVSFNDVLAEIAPRQTVLCYAVVPRIDPKLGISDGTDYVRWAIGPDHALSVRRIGPTDHIDRLIKEYSTLLTDIQARTSRATEEIRFQRLSRELHELLMGDVTTPDLVVIPDGQLHTLSFAAFIEQDGKYVIERSDVSYLYGLREFIPRDAIEPSSGEAVLLSNSPVAKSENPPLIYAPLTFTPSLPLLPNSAKEVEGIADLIGPEHSRVWTGSQSSEALLKRLTSPVILHVASHGYYLGTDEGDSDPYLTLELGYNPLSSASAGIAYKGSDANRLMRSFLALSEYDQVRSLGEEDGILTPLEILGLRLDGTDLVVASACGTGLGRTVGGDGVYGLRSAFAAAGSRTQVVTLWNTDDVAARGLMINFYDLMLNRRQPKLSALAEAQRQYAHDIQFGDPYYWGGFIGSGQNRPLMLSRTESK